MGSTEKAARTALRAMGASLVASPLARTAVQLAARLDAEPGDRSLVMLSRELRLVLAQLRAEHFGEGAGSDEVDAFVARLAAADGGHAAHG